MEYLSELLPKYPDVEILWRPIEAHPRNEEPNHRPYVDLIVQGCLYIQETGGDVFAFTQRVYNAHYEENLNVEDVSVLVKCAAKSGVADIAAFETALKTAKYKEAMLDANDYAYEQKGVWAVPTFICGELRLDAVGGVGVTKQQLDNFLKSKQRLKSEHRIE